MLVDVKFEMEWNGKIIGGCDIVQVFGVLRRNLAVAVARLVFHDVIPEKLFIVVNCQLQTFGIRFNVSCDGLFNK